MIGKKGTLFIISAPSGCGKTTIVNRVIKSLRNIKRSISATTRSLRADEKKNKDYYFISEKTFKENAKKGKFLEWATNFGYYYGTPKKKVLDALKNGKDIILTIDVKGATQVKRKMKKSVSVFVMPPSVKELEKRLKGRATDNNKEISTRLQVAKKEMAYSKKYDFVIINDNLNEAIGKLKSIIITKRCKVDRNTVR